jgi:hypothetical protein
MTGIFMPKIRTLARRVRGRHAISAGRPLREIQWTAVWSAATRDKHCSMTRKENLVTEENLTPRAANP